MSDAIVRTLWRLAVSRRHLLEWIPADLLGNMRQTFLSFYARMSRGVLLAAVVLGIAALLADEPLPAVAWVLTALWVVSPAIAWRISRTPPHAARSELDEPQQRELRLIARRTWRFFETFVTPEDNHLPPDNFQEDPRPVVAHRTSPTNIGLYLLSVAAARDFGWCGLRDALDRIEATLATLARMQKCHGHLFNWYDTHDLHPLEPRYVSSVDSGNLAAHLITLAGACREWQENSAPPAHARDGLGDAFDLARESLRAFRFAPGLTITRGLLETAFTDLEATLRPGAGRTPTATMTSSTGSKPRAARSTAGAATCWRATRRATSSSTWRCWPRTRSSSRARWSSASCSTASASCCPSAIGLPMVHSIRPATTCSRRRRASRASSRSRRATSPRATGSGSAARSRRSALAPLSYPGPARCSNT
jgi:hypothetical protein